MDWTPMFDNVIERADARKRGLKRYFTGRPCKNGHVSERFTSTAACLDCALKQSSEWRESNREKFLDCNRSRYQKNIDQFREASRNRKRSEQDAATGRARVKLWRRNNPEKVVAAKSAHRAAKMNRTPAWFGEFDKFVATEAAHLAKLREASTSFPWDVDHCIPLLAQTASGLHCAENLQVIPKRLNISKKNKMLMTERFDWLNYCCKDGETANA